MATSEIKAPEAPARMVIAWFPPPSALRRGADESVTIVPPSGWAVCDGTKGTSDLSNRFIIDGLRNEGIGSSAGCRRLMCWNSACRDLRRFESTESGSEVNRLIEGVCGKRLPTVNFPHVDLS